MHIAYAAHCTLHTAYSKNCNVSCSFYSFLRSISFRFVSFQCSSCVLLLLFFGLIWNSVLFNQRQLKTKMAGNRKRRCEIKKKKNREKEFMQQNVVHIILHVFFPLFNGVPSCRIFLQHSLLLANINIECLMMISYGF